MENSQIGRVACPGQIQRLLGTMNQYRKDVLCFTVVPRVQSRSHLETTALG